MGKNLKTIAKHTFVYGMGGVFQKGIGFFLIPLYTYYLAPAEYGISHLVALTSAFIVFFISLNMSYSLLRFFAKYQGTEKEGLVVSTALISIAVVGSLSLAVVLPASGLLSRLMTGSRENSRLFMLMAGYNVFEIVATCCLTYLRALRKSVLFVILSLMQFLCAVGLNLFFVAVKGYGVTGIWLSALISQGVVSVPLALWVFRQRGGEFSMDLLREMLAYGIPMLPGNISEYLMHYIDRPILRVLGSLSLVGTYSLGHKFGLLVCLFVVIPFEQMWSAQLFSTANEDKPGETYARIATYYVMALAVAALAIGLLAPFAIRLMAHERYHSAAAVVPIIAAAYVWFGMSRILRTGLLLKQRTGLISWITMGSLGVELAADVLLIPRYGALGSAMSLCIGFFAMALATGAVANRQYAIPFEYGRMVVVLLLVIGCFAISRVFHATAMVGGIIVNLLLVLGFAGVLVAIELPRRHRETTPPEAALSEK